MSSARLKNTRSTQETGFLHTSNEEETEIPNALKYTFRGNFTKICAIDI